MVITQEFKNKCDRIIKAWDDLLYGGSKEVWKNSSWEQINNRIIKGKDVILNDQFFKSFKERTAEEQQYFYKLLQVNYSDDSNKDIAWVIWRTQDERSKIGSDAGLMVYNAYELLRQFLLMVNGEKWSNIEQLNSLVQGEQYTDKDLGVFKELGIEDDQEKKECVKECYRLLEIYNKWIKDTYNTDKQVEIHFAHIKKDGSEVNYDKIRGGEANGVSNVDGSGNHIAHLKLDRYDSDDKFRAGMVWFTMAHELSHCHVGRLVALEKIPFEKIHASHSLNFWKYFLHNSGGFTTNKLIKDNIKDKYWKEYFRNSLPSEFPDKVLIEDALKVYWPELFLQNVWEKFPQTKKEGIDPSTLTIQKDINVPAKKTDWVWKRLSSGLIELIDEEFRTGKYDKTNIDYIWAKMNVINKEEDEDILIRVGYRKGSSLEKKINELIDTAMGNKETLALSERQKITNLIGMWFPWVCGKLENWENTEELVEENFKWISQSSSQLKEIFKEDWSAFIEQLKQQVNIEVSADYDRKYQEAITAGKKLLEKVNDKTTKALIEVPPKKIS